MGQSLNTELRMLSTTIEEISVETSELKNILNEKPDTLIIDVRPSSEIDKVIKSDKWLNILHYELRPMFKLTPAAFEIKFKMKKPEKEDLIILYCKQGRRAQDGVNSLNEIGFRQAKNYFGGIDRWQKEGNLLLA